MLKSINLIHLLDYSPIFKAVLLEINSLPVQSIDFVKNKLNFKDK